MNIRKYLIVSVKLVIWTSLLFLIGSTLLVLTLRWVDPPSSAFIFAYNLGSDKKAVQKWVPIDAVSPWLQISVISSEDQKFPQHSGFDIESIQKALNEKRGRPRGASTITQQVAKNLFLWNGRSYIRKGIEVWFTFLLELFWSKERILEVYLNVAEFGPGIYGAEAAAQSFYRKSAIKLSPWQSGLLAAVLPNPKKMSAKTPSEYVQSRAAQIYAEVEQLGGTAFLHNL
jgi:monofunctional biosynthetic peptidoglycan transglycosylase